MSSPDILERIAETSAGRLSEQERGHLMDAAHLIRTLQARNEEVCNLYLATGREYVCPGCGRGYGVADSAPEQR